MNTFSMSITPSEFNDYQVNVVPLMNSTALEQGILPKALTKLVSIKTKWDELSAASNSDHTKGLVATTILALRILLWFQCYRLQVSSI